MMLEYINVKKFYRFAMKKDFYHRENALWEHIIIIGYNLH